ncbi:extracellular solute-binding protein [Castellaniella sp. MT123]|uniref:ABC transporter substrate-binding protein n=1 Tax=Castellaniella sp. MT123 TaxID=3140381 RepID=UPI0031F3B93A
MKYTPSQASMTMSRRDIIRSLGAAGLLAMAPKLSFAAGGTLVVSNWGGDWNDRTIRYVEKPLVESQGIRIVRDLGVEADRKAKVLAERRLPRGTIDVMHINQGDAYELHNYGVLADLDKSKISNFASVPEQLQTMPYFVPWLYSGVVIIFNKDKVPDPPKSYKELWDKKWLGKLGLTNQLYFNYVMMASLVASGKVNDGEAGMKQLLELKKLTEPKIYATHQHLQSALLTGEVDIAVNYKARGLQWIHDGAPLDIQFPGGGAISVMFGASLLKKAPNLDAAYVYLNAMLDKRAMAGLAQASFYAPANANAELPADVRAKIDFSSEERGLLHMPDYPYVAKNTAAWLEWWNKSIAV